MRIIIEGHIGLDQFAFVFDVNILGAIDHYLADLRIVEQELNWAITQQVVNNILNEMQPQGLWKLHAGSFVGFSQHFSNDSLSLSGIRWDLVQFRCHSVDQVDF
jgi:hypothetical protein